MINEIKGNNIILREQKIEDVKFFTYWYNQPLVMFQCGFTKLTDEEAEKERIKIGHKQKDSVWYTITDLEGNIIGETGLLRMWPTWNCTDLSIIIPDPKMQHRGYGTEAIKLISEYGFKYLNLHSIKLDLLSANKRAHKCYLKCGFKDT